MILFVSFTKHVNVFMRICSNKYLLFLYFIKRPTNCWQSLTAEDCSLYVSSKRLHFDNCVFIVLLSLLDMICVSLHQPIGLLKLQIQYITLDLLFWDNDCEQYCLLGFYALYSTGRTTKFLEDLLLSELQPWRWRQ
jgi:hypothetical protein